MPYNTLINRLLLVTIYINQVCIPLVYIPKHSTTSVNLSQPTSMLNFFFLFGIFRVKYVTLLANTPMPSVGLGGRQFLRTIKFSSGCSVRESHSPPSCEKKQILFILFSHLFSLSLQHTLYFLLTALSALSHLHHLILHASHFPSFFLSFFGSWLALTIPPISILGGLARGRLADPALRRALRVISYDYWEVSASGRKEKKEIKVKEATPKRAFMGAFILWEQYRLLKMRFQRDCILNMLMLQGSLGEPLSLWNELVPQDLTSWK